MSDARTEALNSYGHFGISFLRTKSDWAVRFQWGYERKDYFLPTYTHFFQIGWTHDPDYCGRRWPIALRVHSGGIGNVLWGTHRA